MENRVLGGRRHRGGRHRGDPRVDEDGDAGRGRGRRHGHRDRLHRGAGGQRGRPARRAGVTRLERGPEQQLACPRVSSSAPTRELADGKLIGGGLELALACDLRVAQEGIKLGMPPAKLGLVYSHTGLRRFLDAIGAARTRELFLLGRYVDAPVALSWGLVNRVASSAELEATTLELAAELAGNAPLSPAGNKPVIAEP